MKKKEIAAKCVLTDLELLFNKNAIASLMDYSFSMSFFIFFF